MNETNGKRLNNKKFVTIYTLSSLIFYYKNKIVYICNLIKSQNNYIVERNTEKLKQQIYKHWKNKQ